MWLKTASYSFFCDAGFEIRDVILLSGKKNFISANQLRERLRCVIQYLVATQFLKGMRNTNESLKFEVVQEFGSCFIKYQRAKG